MEQTTKERLWSSHRTAVEVFGVQEWENRIKEGEIDVSCGQK